MKIQEDFIITLNRTYPNPFPTPVSRSLTTRTPSILPHSAKAFQTLSSFISVKYNKFGQ